jgi:hypothetical protein
MTPKAKNAALFKRTLQDTESDLKELHLMGHIPMGWQGMDDDPVEPHKTRITLRLDADMVRWFRKLGPRYQTRMNKILRMYYTGVISGEISIAQMADEDIRAAAEEERKFQIYREEVRARVRGE